MYNTKQAYINVQESESVEMVAEAEEWRAVPQLQTIHT